MSLPRGSREGREGERDPALFRPSRFWLLLLLVPGGLLIAAAILIALPGLMLLCSGLRRLSTASDRGDLRATQDRQPNEESHEPRPRASTPGTKTSERGAGREATVTTAHVPARPRIPWAACGAHGAATGEPPVWAAPPSMEAH
jgi:hypothetical protein